MSQKENIYLNRIYSRHIPQAEERYPYTIPVIRDLKELTFEKSVTYIVGPNGSGKSTILEAIAILLKMNPEGGSGNFNFHTVETHSDLWSDMVASRSDLTYRDTFFFRAESYYNVASEIDRLQQVDGQMYRSYGGRSIHSVSHGEGFMALIQKRLQGKGIYIFDEPEAALSFQNQLAFLCWMKEAVGNGAQIIIATHSPVVLSYPNACIYEIRDYCLQQASFQDTCVYKDMYGFMLNRELYLRELGLLT